MPNSEVESGLEDQLLRTESVEDGQDHVAITLPTSTNIIDEHYANQEVECLKVSILKILMLDTNNGTS